MWPIIVGFARTYAPYITLPFAVVVGFVGYNFESLFNRETPWKEKTIIEERNERKLKELEERNATDVASLKTNQHVPVLERNDYSRIKPSS